MKLKEVRLRLNIRIISIGKSARNIIVFLTQEISDRGLYGYLSGILGQMVELNGL